jgi:hypothetical protein
LEGRTLKAVFPDGAAKWTTTIRGADLFGGFDFDNDGWIDLGFIVSTPTKETYQGHTLQTTQLFLVRGKTGEVVDITRPLLDKWWPKLGYPTSQWAGSSLLFGSRTPVFSLAPFYAERGFFHRYANGTFVKDQFVYPSTPAYDSTYRHAKPNAYENGFSYIENSHINNGLFVQVNGQERLLFFASGRVVQYAAGAFGSEQLLCDHPFLNGGRKDLAGRGYGVVALDPASNIVTLVSGTHTYSVYLDMKAGTKKADPWGSIERHVTVYDYVKDSLDHRFFSSAHDHGDAGDQYQRRVVYPANIYIPTKPGQASRIAYNVYQDGQWHLHISEPGSTADRLVLDGQFLWDIVECAGQTQLVMSPAIASSRSDLEAGYFPAWSTGMQTWDEASQRLISAGSIEHAIPHLLPKFREGDKSTSYGSLYPVLTVDEHGEQTLLLERRDGRLFLRGHSDN